MKIDRFKKDRGNTYKVYFEDSTVITLYDDVIVKYNLLSNKNMDNNLFNEITTYNDFLNGYYKSIKYINKRLRSELEIDKYLKKLEVNSKDIKKIINLLYKDGYLNKEVYIKAYINDKYNLSNDGLIKIEKDLVKLGYKREDFIKDLNNLDWIIKIEKLVDKKIRVNHNLSNNMLKNKIINDLINLGYEKSDIISVLENKIFKNDKELLIKEYNKIKKKYQNKYDKRELEYKINNYLFKKGFNIEDIRGIDYEE